MTKTQARITELWAEHPGSRSRRRMDELRRLVWRDLQSAARRARKAANG